MLNFLIYNVNRFPFERGLAVYCNSDDGHVYQPNERAICREPHENNPQKVVCGPVETSKFVMLVDSNGRKRSHKKLVSRIQRLRGDVLAVLSAREYFERDPDMCLADSLASITNGVPRTTQKAPDIFAAWDAVVAIARGQNTGQAHYHITAPAAKPDTPDFRGDPSRYKDTGIRGVDPASTFMRHLTEDEVTASRLSHGDPPFRDELMFPQRGRRGIRFG